VCIKLLLLNQSGIARADRVSFQGLGRWESHRRTQPRCPLSPAVPHSHSTKGLARPLLENRGVSPARVFQVASVAMRVAKTTFSQNCTVRLRALMPATIHSPRLGPRQSSLDPMRDVQPLCGPSRFQNKQVSTIEPFAQWALILQIAPPSMPLP